MFGPLEVWRDGQPIALGAAKQRALLALLLIRHAEVGRDVLIDAVWGENPPGGARNTLQVYVSKLRKALGPNVIETTPTGYRVRSEAGAVDAERFGPLFAEGRESLAAGDAAGAERSFPRRCFVAWGRPLRICAMRRLRRPEAGRLDELRLACLEERERERERIDADLALGRHPALIGELEAVILEQPLRERLRGQFIVALYRSGRQSEALAQYQAARRMLADELGLEPSPELRELERMILAHDPGLAAPRVSEKPPSNLHAQPTPFIGRQKELEEAAEIMRRRDVRLLTFTGPGGSGKTRLALQLAAEIRDEFPDGVFFVDLAPISDARLVVATVAQTLDVRAQAAEPLETAVAGYLGERRILLLLDNFEQVLSAAPSVSALLAVAPSLNVLVTSRAPLRIGGEHESPAPPLHLPELMELHDPDFLSRCEAVALFVERAQAVKPDFALTEYNASAVAEICVRLDGLPLAIELAAARVRALAPATLLERLEPRLSLLSGGPRDAPARQQTLRAALDWSNALLGGEAQRLFGQLSVFVGGWNLEGTEAIADRDVAVVDVLASLVENNLVREVEDTAGGARYAMLETIREYAGELLAHSGEAEAVGRRHAEYVLTLADRADARMSGRDFSFSGEPEKRIREELPNLRAALEWAVESHEPLALRLATAGAYAWTSSGAG